LVIDSNPRRFREATSAMTDPMLPLPGLSPVSGKSVVAKFDGGLPSSDGGVLVLREVEQRLGVADRLAACLVDPRAPDLITHTLADINRFRLLMIGAGYAVGNDADSPRSDPCSKWRSIWRRQMANCVRRRPFPVWKTCRTPAHGPRHGRSELQLLPEGSQADHARYRRHVRRGSSSSPRASSR
jgi:hypothetical protein